jgi:hypothetical protein
MDGKEVEGQMTHRSCITKGSTARSGRGLESEGNSSKGLLTVVGAIAGLDVCGQMVVKWQRRQNASSIHTAMQSKDLMARM